jgi:hypothetical protein
MTVLLKKMITLFCLTAGDDCLAEEDDNCLFCLTADDDCLAEEDDNCLSVLSQT